MVLSEINSTNHKQVNIFLIEHWYSTEMVVRGTVFDLSKCDGIIAYDDNGNIIGLLTYMITKDACEILSLDSIVPGQGLGTTLLQWVTEHAKANNCKKITLITTNDNMNAMQFYQKRGFDMVKVYPNAVAKARELKPDIPLIGDNAIPLKHEVEFVMPL